VKEITDISIIEMPFVIDFYADWCAPCKALAPHIEELAEGNPAVHFYKCDIEKSPNLVASYNIRNIPFVVINNHGRRESFVAKSKKDITDKMTLVGL
jgi:thioredoxin 2